MSKISVFFALCASLLATSAGAEPRIENWSTEIRIHEDNALTITEEIDVDVPADSDLKNFSHLLPSRPGPDGKMGSPIKYEVLRASINGHGVIPLLFLGESNIQIKLGQATPFAGGSNKFSVQLKARDVRYADKVQGVEKIAWPLTLKFPGGVNNYSLAVIPPQSIEATKLGVEIYDFSSGLLKIKKPQLTIKDGRILAKASPDNPGGIVMAIFSLPDAKAAQRG